MLVGVFSFAFFFRGCRGIFFFAFLLLLHVAVVRVIGAVIKARISRNIFSLKRNIVSRKRNIVSHKRNILVIHFQFLTGFQKQCDDEIAVGVGGVVLDEADHPLLFQTIEDTEKSGAVDAQLSRQGISAAVHHALMCDGAQEKINKTVDLPGKLT